MKDALTITLPMPQTPDSIRAMSEDEWERRHLQMRADLQALVSRYSQRRSMEIEELHDLVEKMRDQGARMTDYLRWRGVPNAPVAPSGWMCRGDLKEHEVSTIVDLIG